MKISKVLKILGAAAAVAALTPFEVERDEETGATSLKALLWGAKYTPAADGTGRNVDVTIGLNIPGRTSEAELFADDEPEAAVPDLGDLQVAVDSEDLTVADEVQEAAGEAQEAADEVEETAETGHAPEL